MKKRNLFPKVINREIRFCLRRCDKKYNREEIRDRPCNQHKEKTAYGTDEKTDRKAKENTPPPSFPSNKYHGPSAVQPAQLTPPKAGYWGCCLSMQGQNWRVANSGNRITNNGISFPHGQNRSYRDAVVIPGPDDRDPVCPNRKARFSPAIFAASHFR